MCVCLLVLFIIIIIIAIILLLRVIAQQQQQQKTKIRRNITNSKKKRILYKFKTAKNTHTQNKKHTTAALLHSSHSRVCLCVCVCVFVCALFLTLFHFQSLFFVRSFVRSFTRSFALFVFISSCSRFVALARIIIYVRIILLSIVSTANFITITIITTYYTIFC